MVAAGSEHIPGKPGRLTKALTRLWMKPATVTANEQLGERFRLIEILGEGAGQ